MRVQNNISSSNIGLEFIWKQNCSHAVKNFKNSFLEHNKLIWQEYKIQENLVIKRSYLLYVIQSGPHGPNTRRNVGHTLMVSHPYFSTNISLETLTLSSFSLPSATHQLNLSSSPFSSIFAHTLSQTLGSSLFLQNLFDS